MIEHNHYFAAYEERHMLISAQHIDNVNGDLVKSLLACYMKPFKIYDVISKQTERENNVDS